ncbi:hypothetical protein [Glycomyces dulcitolivorans]|uniref:hypothetical protein n=1 Tax=Glycomyces dulcitolivorans TaxID=2200759 RepID=UPI000DD4C061|nr:hypothetical protein [Glycomyces dulcitolivorans]
MKKSIYSLLAALALAASMLFGIPGGAGATPEAPATYEAAVDDVSIKGWPTGCQSEGAIGHGWRVKCNRSNGGSWHAVVVCQPWGVDDTYQRFGQWRTSGWSTAYCSPQSSAINGFMVQRSS